MEISPINSRILKRGDIYLGHTNGDEINPFYSARGKVVSVKKSSYKVEYDNGLSEQLSYRKSRGGINNLRVNFLVRVSSNGDIIRVFVGCPRIRKKREMLIKMISEEMSLSDS